MTDKKESKALPKLLPLPKANREEEVQVAIRLSKENHIKVHNDAAKAGCPSVAAYIRKCLGLAPTIRQ